MTLLSVAGVHTFYGNIEALRGVDVRIEQGEIVTIIGANGAGKSTLLMSICGRPTPSAGEILFEGQRLNELVAHDIVAKGIAQAPEGRRIFSGM
jgi:branched-chain amino acid transport system ATP-binding protein